MADEVQKSKRVSRLIKLLVIFGLFILIVGGVVWYQQIYMSNERRFWSAIDDAFSNVSITKLNEATSQNQNIDQRTRQTFSPDPKSVSRTIIKQRGSTGESVVVTDTVTTPKAFLVRYDKIDTTERKTDGSQFDFSKIVGQWATQGDSSTNESQYRDNYIRGLFTIVPFGNAPFSLRNQVINTLKTNGAYKIDYSSAKSVDVNGVKSLAFDVEVNVKKYLEAMQPYYKAIGFEDQTELNPDSYGDTENLKAVFTVDKKSGFLNSATVQGEREDKFSGYGITKSQELPKKEDTIGIDELENRLQSLD